MSNADTLEKYLKENIKTGQDLIDLKIIPKNSSELMALIFYLRLQVLHKRIGSTLGEDTLGKWIPAAVEDKPLEYAPGTSLQSISFPPGSSIKAGTRVVASSDAQGHAPNTPTKTVKGALRTSSGSYYGIESDELLSNGNDLDKKCPSGKGFWTYAKYIALENKLEVKTYKLTPGAQADEKGGHFIRFAQKYEGPAQQRGSSGEINANVEAGSTGQLISASGSNVQLKVENPTKTSTRYLTFNINRLVNILEVSSLGQYYPKELEPEVRRKSLLEFFPSTALDEETVEDAIVAIFMKKDTVFHGPPGSGKSQVIKDIVSFVDGLPLFIAGECQCQCNPYSLFDPKFEKEVIPCVSCMMEFGKGDYYKTGIFIPPDSKKVPVIVARLSEGRGIEIKEGSPMLGRHDLSGQKLPFDESRKDKDGHRLPMYHPAGFEVGIFSRGNNGFTIFEELHLLREDAILNLLTVIQDNKTCPDKQRYPYPAHSLILGTVNLIGKFPDAFNDRVMFVNISYSGNPDVCHDIMRRAYHREHVKIEQDELPDVNVLPPVRVRSIPLPVTLEKAASRLYIELRDNYTKEGKYGASGTNRSQLDALLASKAFLVLDQIFYSNCPACVTEEYLIKGIKHALKNRVQEDEHKLREKYQAAICKWVEETFPKQLKEENDVWWCKVEQDMQLGNLINPGMYADYQTELQRYEQDAGETSILSSYKQVKNADANFLEAGSAEVLLKSPFMGYLSKMQPDLFRLNPNEPQQAREIKENINYLLQKGKEASCRIVSSKKA